VAELIASEFFEQGDIEKHELKMTPMDVMDREKSSELPRMQIGFIDFVCMPVYEVSVWTAHIPWTDIGTSGGFPSLPYPSLLPSRISAPFQLKKLHLSVVTATSFARQSDNTRQPALIFPTS